MSRYELANGGWAIFDWEKDVQAVQPMYENTLVTLNNGTRYLLKGRNYKV